MPVRVKKTRKNKKGEPRSDSIGAEKALIMRVILAILLLFAGASSALAGSESCEKIKDADAYNACLASFGPAAGEHQTTRAPPPDEKPSAAPARGARRHADGSRVASRPELRPARKSNGRVRLEFMVPASR